jgi:hypothetical protein
LTHRIAIIFPIELHGESHIRGNSALCHRIYLHPTLKRSKASAYFFQRQAGLLTSSRPATLVGRNTSVPRGFNPLLVGMIPPLGPPPSKFRGPMPPTSALTDASRIRGIGPVRPRASLLWFARASLTRILTRGIIPDRRVSRLGDSSKDRRTVFPSPTACTGPTSCKPYATALLFNDCPLDLQLDLGSCPGQNSNQHHSVFSGH